MAATFDYQAQLILSGKVDAIGDIVRIPRRDGVHARLCCPCIDPSQRLRQSRLIANVIRILQIRPHNLSLRAGRVGF
jgi:hypothetical protein